MRARRLEQHGVRPDGAGQLELEPRATAHGGISGGAEPPPPPAPEPEPPPPPPPPPAPAPLRRHRRARRPPRGARARSMSRELQSRWPNPPEATVIRSLGAHTADGVVVVAAVSRPSCRERAVAEPAPPDEDEVLRARPPRVHVAQLEHGRERVRVPPALLVDVAASRDRRPTRRRATPSRAAARPPTARRADAASARPARSDSRGLEAGRARLVAHHLAHHGGPSPEKPCIAPNSRIESAAPVVDDPVGRVEESVSQARAHLVLYLDVELVAVWIEQRHGAAEHLVVVRGRARHQLALARAVAGDRHREGDRGALCEGGAQRLPN